MQKLITVFFVMILIICIVGCGEDKPRLKVDTSEVIKYVQDSESSFPGVNISTAISGLLSVMKKRGAYVDILGWSQEYRLGGIQDVWFKVKTDDELSTFHWVITPDGKLNPANDLSRKVTKKGD